MVVFSTQNYTTQMTTPFLDAKLGKHYARLMHLSLIWLSPLIFVWKMILKVISTSGSICRRLQFYLFVSFSTIFIKYLYCLFKNSWQLISIDNFFPFKQTCPALGRQHLLLFRGWTKLRGDKSLCFMAWGCWYCQDRLFSWTSKYSYSIRATTSVCIELRSHLFRKDGKIFTICPKYIFCIHYF